MNFPQPAALFLPHRPPMLYVQHALAVDDRSAVCETALDDTFAPFFAAAADGTDALPAHFLLEIIAQSIGVWAGYHTLQKGEAAKSGMFLGCRDFTTVRPEYPRGDILRIEVKLLVLDGATGSFEGVVLCAGERIASATLTTHQVTWEQLDALLHPQH
ncbi:MAG: hypothetical protein LBT53_04675 [Puniceicoccales bacterium]|jgi:predicted hotdog family 3-hydroxylacyl-ACP dehydratase|nr:hypothetical protein [Puniceicoccales bacterium]